MRSFLGDILHEAHHLINGARQEDYSDPRENWRRTVDIFNAITSRDLSVYEGVLFMVAVKLAREAHKHKRDNLVDGCGYLAILNHLHEGREGK